MVALMEAPRVGAEAGVEMMTVDTHVAIGTAQTPQVAEMGTFIGALAVLVHDQEAPTDTIDHVEIAVIVTI